ncbi:MAG TPA: glutamate synthase central domain-containing protein, partial [Ktedonobacteraceae bacterium]|nr:glutamate synthase central domain-containing protein [Ktedonobacteraceae bacterium]
MSERDLLHSMQMLIPPAWEHNPELASFQQAWCEYHAGIMEPWDGPAAIAFSDGRFVGATLDRNGLRPARYTLTSHGLLILASEAGVVPFDAHDVVEHGRLGPGEMIAIDLKHSVLLRDAEIKAVLAQRKPYQEWLDTNLVRLTDIHQQAGHATNESLDADTLFHRQQLFGYTHEDVELVLRSMLLENKEPIWSMGDDTPIAVLSGHSRSLSDYFHQRFAQVTNPPIDPLREQIALSLDCYLGRRRNLLAETPLHARLLHLETPLLTDGQLVTLRSLKGFVSQTLPATFQSESEPEALESALDKLELEAVAAVAEGVQLLIISDVSADLNQAPIPMLLAVGSVHRALIQAGLRTYTSLICETYSALDVHQIALLLGYGAEAVAPVLALESVRSLAGERHLETLTQEQAVERYLHVIEEGLRKVMARMGISTIRNIIGGGQFEILGLHADVVQRCFAGSDTVAAHPGEADFKHIAEQVIERVNRMKAQSSQIVLHAIPATSGKKKLEVPENNRRRKLTDIGRFRFRRDGEYHAYNPFIVRALQKASQSGEMADYKEFCKLVYQRPPTSLRDLITFASTKSIPLEQVEPMESIRARFVVSAMSIGALSPETHRTIAAAMNSIGGRNNTGEGGEDPAWYHEQINGYPVSSKIKQVASARFGVTTEYLVRAEELEIKMAQGSKPGEGG